MSQKGVFPIQRKDLEDTLKGLVHAAKRPDIKVGVAYLVQFEVSKENYVSTIIEPWQPLARSRARTLVEEVIKKLDAQEAEERANEAAKHLLVGSIDPGVSANLGVENEVITTTGE